MFTPRFAEPVVRTALAASTLGLAALLAAGTANAGGSDDQYLAALQGQGINFGDTESAITVAHHVYDALGDGMEPSDISHPWPRRTRASMPRPDWSSPSLRRNRIARSSCIRWPMV